MILKHHEKIGRIWRNKHINKFYFLGQIKTVEHLKCWRSWVAEDTVESLWRCSQSCWYCGAWTNQEKRSTPEIFDNDSVEFVETVSTSWTGDDEAGEAPDDDEQRGEQVSRSWCWSGDAGGTVQDCQTSDDESNVIRQSRISCHQWFCQEDHSACSATVLQCWEEESDYINQNLQHVLQSECSLLLWPDQLSDTINIPASPANNINNNNKLLFHAIAPHSVGCWQQISMCL